MGFFTDHAGDGELRKWRLYYIGLSTPIATVAAPVSVGSNTVTPSSMLGIKVGVQLSVMDRDIAAMGCTVSGALAGAGAGNVENGAHSYKMTVNKTGGKHTLPSAASSPVTVADKTTNGQILVTRTGGSLPTGFTWDVFRTAAGDSPTAYANYKKVNPSPIAASTTTYTDNTADASRGAGAPVDSTAGTNAEVVTVTATTATTFTATFAKDHYADWILDAPASLYWTDCDVDIEWDGHTWVAQPIIVGAVSNQPDGAAASFKIADADDTYFPVLAAAGGGELAVAAIYEAGFANDNQTPTPDEVIEIFSGRIDRTVATTAGEDTIEIVLMPQARQESGELPTRLISTLMRGS